MDLLKYNDFLFEDNREVEYLLSHKFCNILAECKSSTKNAQVQDMITCIFESSNNDDVKDNITYIDITDKNDMLSFFDLNKLFQYYYDLKKLTIDRNFQKLSDDEYNKFILNLPELYDDEFSDSKSWIWTDKKRTQINAGRLFQRILKKVNYSFNQSDLEELVNIYKSTYDSMFGDKVFNIASGDDITKWYLEDNYLLKNGDLNNSCMRYKKCQKYFDIYTKNSDKVSLLILQKPDSLDKIIGRSLIWKLDDGKVYMDRVYTCIQSDLELFKKYANDHSYISYYNNNGDLSTTLKNWEFEFYPYMDTFAYLDMSSGIIYDSNDGDYRELQSTDGSWSGDDDGNYVYSERYGENIPRDDASWCEDIDDYLYNDDTYYLEYKNTTVSNDSSVVWSDYYDSWLLEDDSTKSEYLDDYIISNKCISFYLGSKDENEDYIPDNYKVINDEFSGKLTLPSFCYKVNNRYYFKDWTLRLIPKNYFDKIPNDSTQMKYHDNIWVIFESLSFHDQNMMDIDKVEHLTVSIDNYINSLTDKNLSEDEYFDNIMSVVKYLQSNPNRSLLSKGNIYPFNDRCDINSIMAYIYCDPTKSESTVKKFFDNEDLIIKINNTNKNNGLKNVKFFNSELKDNLEYLDTSSFSKFIKSYSDYSDTFLKTTEMLKFFINLKKKVK